MKKLPHGFIAVFIFLCFFLVVVSSSHGTEVIVSETEWNGLKLDYAQLLTLNSQLGKNLLEQESLNSNLSEQLNLLNLKLESLKASSNNTLSALERAEKFNADLQSSLQTSENALSELKQANRKDKIKSYAIGGGIGVVIGIVAGIMIGLQF